MLIEFKQFNYLIWSKLIQILILNYYNFTSIWKSTPNGVPDDKLIVYEKFIILKIL